MRRVLYALGSACWLFLAHPGYAQTDPAEGLKLTAIEALMSAPEAKALPILARVLEDAESTTSMQRRALFVLGQFESAEAQSLLLETARGARGELQQEALRAIGIGGDADTLAELVDIYRAGDADVRHAVLEAYLIADDAGGVMQLALDAETEAEFAAAVEALGAMGALNELRSLRESSGWSESLIAAYAMAGDVESLTALANDGSDAARQVRAIEGLAIAAGRGAGATLADIYRQTASAEVRAAALEGLLIADDEARVVELFRESGDPTEQRRLLEMLVAMDSEAVWDIVDATLAN